MAIVAQLVEHWFVVPGVAGSNPVCRPIDYARICFFARAFVRFQFPYPCLAQRGYLKNQKLRNVLILSMENIKAGFGCSIFER